MSKYLILSAMIVLASLATIRIEAAGEPPPAATIEISQSLPITIRIEAADEPSRSANESKKKESAKSAAANAPVASLLANGGFEEPQEESDDPQAWFGTRISQTAGHFLLAPSSVAHGGKRSVVVEIGDSHPDLKVAYNWTAEAQGWKVGDAYELSGWVKVENSKSPAFIVAQCWGENGQRMVGFATTQTNFPVKGTTGWTRVTTRLWVPEGTAAVRIRAGLPSDDNAGAKAWFDDLSLVAVSRSANESKRSEPAKNASAKTPGASLLANGSFEELEESSNDPQAWFGTRVPRTAGHFQLTSSSVARSGKRSAAVLIGDSHPDSTVHYNWTTDAKGCKSGETYELSGWIKTENAKSPAFIMAQCLSDDGKRIIGYSQKPCHVTGTADWTRVSTLVKVPEGAGIVRIRAGLTSQDNHGAKAWLDDISLVKVATATN